MSTAFEFVSPKQAARAMGVSESSVKRWCDEGRIETVRTAGGHRKLTLGEVLRFAREQGYRLISPELLGLPPVSQQAERGLLRGKPRLAEALLAGDEALARQIVVDLYLANHPLSLICDEVIAAAFHEIGDRWACHAADVYQERRGCELTRRILNDLRKVQAAPQSPWRAIGATIEGDHYALASQMAELVLREVGFQATALGSSIPFASLLRAVEENQPQLFWLSVSYIRGDLDFAEEFQHLSDACEAVGAALVVGGRALTEDLRQRITYSAFGDTMQHLERFAKTLLRTLQRNGHKRPRAATAKPRIGHSSAKKGHR